MSDRQSYFFLNFQGICSPPSYQEVKKSELNGRPFKLIPDNNVCTHVSQYNSSKDKTKRKKVKNFLNYYSTSNITVNPTYGLLERASTPGTLKLNKEKLINCENEFWKKLGHYSQNDRISKEVETIEPLKAILHPMYAYLLMIKMILLERETSRANAKRNVQDLYEFTKEIGVNLVLPWQFAIAMFGGSTELNNKFIKPREGEDIFQALWGAAWDLSYIQLVHQYGGIRERKNNCQPQFILVTDDKQYSTIGNFAKVTSAFDYGNIIYNGVMMNSNFSQLSHVYSFLHEIFLDLERDLRQRAVARISMSDSDIKNYIEQTINRADSFIFELTKQLQLRVNKGFG